MRCAGRIAQQEQKTHHSRGNAGKEMFMDDAYMGEIRMVGFNYAPQGWLLCNGQILQIGQYQALYALLSNTFGGDPSKGTFALPDLQGRVPINAGNGAGLPQYTWGEKGGVVAAAVPVPAHNHTATFTPTGNGTPPTVNVTVQGSSAVGSTTTPTGNYLAGAPKGLTSDGLYVPSPAAATLGNIAGVAATVSGSTGGSGTVAVAATGVNAPTVSVLQPFLAVYFIICVNGLFPIRD
jgi:microcystin-dependent protein